MPRNSWTQALYGAPASRHFGSSWKAIALAVAVGVAYFLAARLSLALLTTPDGIAAFWPGAGLAAGAMIALGRRAWVPVAVAVLLVSTVSSLIGDRSLTTAAVFAACNAAESMLIAWLVERYHGPDFSLTTLPRVLGFFLATGIAVAVTGAGAAVAVALFHAVDAPVLIAWLHWLAADAFGVIAVAPLVIGIAGAVREPPGRGQLAEGAYILVLVGLVSALSFGPQAEHWFTVVPLAMLLPLLMWPAARCPPVFAAAAVFVVALAIVATLTFGIGRLGDTSVPLSDRLHAAQSALMVVSFCTLVVTALFAERHSREALLSRSNARLRNQEEAFRRLLGALPAAIYTTDRAGAITYCNDAAVALWGRNPELGKDKWFDLWRLHYPDGSSVPLDERPTRIVLNEGRAVRGQEALLERPDGGLVPIMPCPAPLVDEHGKTIGVVNMQVDLTELKRAEAALAERDAWLALASKAARVGSYSLDCTTDILRLSPICAALYGLPEGTTELSRADRSALAHPQDLSELDAELARACKAQQREHTAQFRIVRRTDGDWRWIETRSVISYAAGRAVRIVGIAIDVTERRHAEAVLRESESRLADALSAGQVVAFEWDAATHRSQRSANAASILGFEEGDGERGLQSDNFFPHVHPDDRQLFKAHIRDLRADNPSYALSFRFRSPDGRQLWLEETGKGEFDATGRLLRIKGLTRNITDRKTAERALDERNVQLSLAGKAALVGSFVHDLEADEIQISEGYAATHGLPEGTVRTTPAIWRSRMHAEDVARVDALRSRTFRDRRGEFETEYRIVRPTGEMRWIEARCFVSYGNDGRPERIVGVNIDVTERKRAEEHQRMLVAELDHRVKNVLATVSAVASRTQDAGLSGADFAANLAGRIRSMAATHELLSCRQWKGVSIRQLVHCVLAPYMIGSNTAIDGPDLTLSPEAAQAVSMVLHELATNAAKHGSLSTDDGRVSVRWDFAPSGCASDRVHVTWQESAGPAVRSPERFGYGMEVIRNLIPYQLGGTVDLTLAPEGVRCDIAIPAADVLGQRPSCPAAHSTMNTLASSEIS